MLLRLNVSSQWACEERLKDLKNGAVEPSDLRGSRHLLVVSLLSRTSSPCNSQNLNTPKLSNSLAAYDTIVLQ